MREALSIEELVRGPFSGAQRRTSVSMRRLQQVFQEVQHLGGAQTHSHSREEFRVRRVRSRVRASFPVSDSSQASLREVHEALRHLQQGFLHERRAPRSHEREARRQGARVHRLRQIVSQQSHPRAPHEDPRSELQAGEASVRVLRQDVRLQELAGGARRVPHR